MWPCVYEDILVCTYSALMPPSILRISQAAQVPVYGDRRCILPNFHCLIESMDTMLDHFHKQDSHIPQSDTYISQEVMRKL